MSDANCHIDFVLTGRVKGMHFQPWRPEGIEFTATDPTPVRFTLRPNNVRDDPPDFLSGLECRVYACYPVSEYQRAFADAYNSRNTMLDVANDITLPHTVNGCEQIAADGTFPANVHPRRRHCPAEISQLLDQVEIDLAARMDRFLKLIRWRQGVDASGELVESRTLFWRVADGMYPVAPLPDHSPAEITFPAMFGIHWEADNVSDLAKLWPQTDVTEPLGHTLLREAETLVQESPRSAILIITAALETAVKMHISKVAPDTAWLMEEIPSPPMFKILRHYIPNIHALRGNELQYWSKLGPWFSKVQKLIEVRNKVAHTGMIPPSAPRLSDCFKTVRDLLYTFDVLNGHEWAKELVSASLRATLGWPSPKHSRVLIRLRVRH